jgi:hypothetical protein
MLPATRRPNVKTSSPPRITCVSMTLEEAADRVAVRELIDAYARCADPRDAGGQMALFTALAVL